MYVPHYDALLHNIGTSRNDLRDKQTVEIPLSLFKFLLQIALSQSDLNLAGYLAANRDVQDATKSGQIPDPSAHYVRFGFFEGRHGGTPAVDELWYRKHYPDIAEAIRKGEIRSGAEHFNVIGSEEFRAPSSIYLEDAMEWAKACRGVHP